MNVLKGYSVGFIFLFAINYSSEFFREFYPASKEFYLTYSWIGFVLIFPLYVYVLVQLFGISKTYKTNRAKANTFVLAAVIGFFSGAYVLKNMGII